MPAPAHASAADPFAIEAARAVPDPLAKIGPADIARLFGREPSWFDRAGRRAQLYAGGFPRPLTRGVWLKRAVVAYILRTSVDQEANLPLDPEPANDPAPAPSDLDDVMRRTREFLGRRTKPKAATARG